MVPAVPDWVKVQDLNSKLKLSETILARLKKALRVSRCCRLPALSFAATSCLALNMRSVFSRPLVVVTDSMRTMAELHRNLKALAGGDADGIVLYPASETLAEQKNALPAETAGDRFAALERLAQAPADLVVVTCVQAMMQKALHPSVLAARTIRLALHEVCDPDMLARQLEEYGYVWEADVGAKGQAARRGAILDVWPVTEENPLRIEFLGTNVETIRVFDPADQRSRATRTAAALPPANETSAMGSTADRGCLLADCLPPQTIYYWAEPLTLEPGRRPIGIGYHAAIYEEALAESCIRDMTVPFAELCRKIEANAQAWQCLPDPVFAHTPEGAARQSAWPPLAELIDPGFRPVAEMAVARRNILDPDIFAGQRRQWMEDIIAKAALGRATFFYFNTASGLERFCELYPNTQLQLCVGGLSDGFMHPEMNLAVLAESNWLGRPKLLPDRERSLRLSGAAREHNEVISDWSRMEPGDYVVHIEHGIGRYLGLSEIVFNGKLQETLAIEYADKTKLYVPVSHSHLLSRYVGVGKRYAPQVHRLGSARWGNEKNAAERAVQDMAATLLETQALRQTMDGFAFPPDTAWQHEFEAAFPYQETEDQERAIDDVKNDMRCSRPMERLVCGDVGYGKTEVALRAAFKCVMAGKQVAVLVPTTVLAQQHFDVFAERMAAYPVRIELLCRFRTLSEQAAVLRALAAGVVDIVIGTHRLIQPDVRFRDLGLLIIDEEQRFGVEHKERLKELNRLVDVLTLTATPIPRTLYQSLMGAREISMIQTSPKARLPVETILAKNEDQIVRRAILRELNRGGQVYYLHNRVRTIEHVRAKLERLAPEARIVVGHGQMPTTALAGVMRAFAAGQYDVLLCTTIIESGLDIPNVNTILIDRADRFGMADLYQLRGRVGRSDRKAYAYLLLPTHGYVQDASRQRVQAILQHAELGAGFRLAMRDLEIRGAGNLLGSQQSGHIAAIGFELYCRLLRHAVAHLSDPSQVGRSFTPLQLLNVEVRLDFVDFSVNAAEADGAAVLPRLYVEDERARIEVYRQIAACSALPELDALRESLRDRYGPPPVSFERLLKIAALRILANEKQIRSIKVENGRLMLDRHGDLLQIRHCFPRLRAAGTDERLDEIADWLKRVNASGFNPETAPAQLPPCTRTRPR